MKSKFLFRSLALVALVAAAIVSLAQEMPSAKQILLGIRGVMLLQKEWIEELKISPDQLKKINAAYEDCVTVDGDRIVIQMTPDMDMEKMDKDAWKVLDDAQRARATELWIQHHSFFALGDAEIAKKLEVTADQSKKIDKIFEDTKDELLDLMMSDQSEDSIKKSEDLRNAGAKKIEAVLTVEQVRKFEAMKGKPFKREKKAGGVAQV